MDKRLTILQGNSLDVLKGLPDVSVQTCVTSPPYWGLRSYLPKDHPLKRFEIGTEKTPEEFVAKLVAVFSEVRRVLKDDGVLWVNMGDSYNSALGKRKANDKAGAKQQSNGGSPCAPSRHVPTLKSKDLVGVPWMLAFALRADGWYLRSDIIWNKPNPMPESVTDRPTKAHEYIFLLTKSAKYFYDSDAVSEPVTDSSTARLLQPNLKNQNGSNRVPGKTNGAMKAVGTPRNDGQRWNENDGRGFLGDGMRNRRTVWTVSTATFTGAHFATFPPELILPCIRAGSRLGDTVLDPFGGSGTTGKVALEEGRKAILIELNPDYHPLIQQRCNVTPGLAI